MAEPFEHATPEQVLLLAAGTPAELERQLQVSDTGLLDRDNAGAPPDGGPCRLAIVGPTARRLALARRIVAQGTPWRGRNDVWFTAAPLHAQPAPGQLAFLFPGLEQRFEPRMDDIAEHFELERPKIGSTAVLSEHSLGVFTLGRFLDAALRRLGVVPDLVAGHSVGEWNAMAAAGIHPHHALEEFIAWYDPSALHVPDVVFAALGCGADQAAEAISGRDDIVVSHDNCPHQSIICGAEAAVADVLNRLHAGGITGHVLPFRSGFHSPMLKPFLHRILETFGSLPVHPPVHPVWSATTAERYPEDPEGIRELAARHLLEPVRFGPLLRRLYEAGVRAFVQVGTGSLPGFVADTLVGLPHLAVTANTPRRSGLDQLRRVAAALWVEGWAPRFDRLPCASRVGAAAAPTPAPSAPPLPPGLPEPGHPVLAEFEAVLREATAAAADVLGVWARGSWARGSWARGSWARGSWARGSWARGSWAQSTPRQASTTRTFSLATLPYLTDHCFYRQPAGWPEPADRYPVVPLTTMLELMADAARALVTNRTVVGFRDVRALRWLAVAPPVTVTTSASLDADGNVTVALDDYACGTVLLADSYPASPQLPDRPLTGQRPCAVTARGLYTDRWMFHGPAFHGVAELGPLADDGIVGELSVLPAPGALLDAAGQLVTFWIMAQTERDRLVFPTAIEQVRFYDAFPRVGERLRCVVRIGSVSPGEVLADLEMRRADGRLWARIDQWRDRRFGTDEVTWPVFRFPERNRIAQRQAGGWFLVRDRWPDPATQELVMRHYLSAAERADYQRRTPRAARQWLLGRIAVKDAVRQWLWDSGAGPVFPIEVTVTDDASGRPQVAGPFVEAPQVSLAHTGSLAAALVGSPGCPPGIDIERITERDEQTVATILTDAERRLLDTLGSSMTERPSWMTRFWTAKEAAAKATGTGLGGRLHQFAVERVDGDRLLVTVGAGAPSRWVQTGVGAGDEPYAVAWTPRRRHKCAPRQMSAHQGGRPDNT